MILKKHHKVNILEIFNSFRDGIRAIRYLQPLVKLKL